VYTAEVVGEPTVVTFSGLPMASPNTTRSILPRGASPEVSASYRDRAGFAWVAVMTFLVVFVSNHFITCAGLLTSAIGALAPGAFLSAGTSVPVG
jgi:hypothetical protein